MAASLCSKHMYLIPGEVAAVDVPDVPMMPEC